jgi:HlyD family secretion protein
VREAGAIVAGGETVYVLSLTSPVWVRSYVAEPDLGRIRPGMKVMIRTDTPGARPLEGRIGFISPTAEFTPKTVETRELRTALVYRFRVVIDDPSGALRQGMPVSITVLGPKGREVGSSP